MPRFFIDCPPAAERVVLGREQARHLAGALRLGPGDAVTLCDGAGMDYTAVIERADTAEVTLRVTGSHPSVGEPGVYAALYVALPKADKMDFVVQKATELGVSEVVPFLSSRCVSRPDAKSLAKKQARWQKIAAEAAGQSGRGRIPVLQPALSFAEAMQRAARAQTALFLYEAERESAFRDALRREPLSQVSLVIGPEGGFSAEEAAAACAAGLRSVTLGKRVLRCETAPLAALAALFYESGDLS